MSLPQFSWLEAYRVDQPNFGLKRMKALLALRGNPHLHLPVIHIGGTNGKGSTIAYLSQCLQKKGWQVGVFSSPYITSYNEQITIQQTPISDEELSQLLASYQTTIEQADKELLLGITEFEIMTALAFEYFLLKKVDVAIMEVGMGGSLDSTNVCQPLLTAITTIGLDHTALLGDTLEEIALQKSGIIKPNIPILTGNIQQNALAIIEKQAQKNLSPLTRYRTDFHSQWMESTKDGEIFSFTSQTREKTIFHTPLLGQHQTENVALAIEIADRYCQLKNVPPLSKQALQEALDATFWPARMEILSTQPLLILDGAHNPHAIAVLVDNLKSHYQDKEIHILFSCIQTKAIHTMLEQLKSSPAKRITLSTFEDNRAFSEDFLTHLTDNKQIFYQDWKETIHHYLTQSPANQTVLIITGSLYFLSQVRKELLNQQH